MDSKLLSAVCFRSASLVVRLSPRCLCLLRSCGMVSTGTPWVLPEDIPALLAEGTNVFSINRPGGLACRCVQRSSPEPQHNPPLDPQRPPLEQKRTCARLNPTLSFRQDLKHFSKMHGFTYAIIWQPIYGGGTDRDGAFIMKKGVPLPEKLKVDTLRSFGGFASASSQHHFVEGQSIPGLAFDRRDWAFVADMQVCTRVRCVCVRARLCACMYACMRPCVRAEACVNGHRHLPPMRPGRRALPTNSGSRSLRSTT